MVCVILTVSTYHKNSMVTKLLQNFPYFSQLDNRFQPNGTCNVTSLAMCLWYFGIRGNGSYPQLEDQIYKLAINNSVNYQSVEGIKWLAESYPDVTDTTSYVGTIQDIIKSIDQNKPVILHGYFTRSGHIIAVKGYNDKGLIVNDPFGEYFINGYQRNTAINPYMGEGLTYSYTMIENLCSPESKPAKNIWMHSINRD